MIDLNTQADELLALVEQAFEDVESDFPEVEGGWESDVAWNVCLGYPEEVQKEVFRRLGFWWPGEEWVR